MDRHSLVWLRDWAENWLAERLTAVAGTAGAEVFVHLFLGHWRQVVMMVIAPAGGRVWGLITCRLRADHA